MTTELNPADAVREALDLIDSLIDDYGSIRHADALETIRDRIAALTARVAELEAENGRLFGDLDLNWVSHQAMVKANKRAEQAEARLAALAGASPVAWRIRLSERGNNPWGPGPWNYEASKPSPSPADFYEVEPLYTHAPAKAREDELLALLRDMWHELVGAEAATGQAPLDTIKQRYDAALATFAEGAE